MVEETHPHDRWLEVIVALHARICDGVVAACESQAEAALAEVVCDDEGDTIYAIDRISERVLIEELSRLAAAEPMVLIAEGIEGGAVTLPRDADPARARWRVIVDPIDGTRGLMYQKRSAWVLTGVAPNRGDQTSLRDIELAVQTEIPLVKQHLADQLWARRGGGGVRARRLDRVTGKARPLRLSPSGAPSILHGCAGLARFFPGARDVLAAIDDDVVRDTLGPQAAGKALCFEDQYASTGGQLYELMAGHDRYVADLRPLMRPVLTERRLPTPLCCHPYDLCTMLIAEELGVIVTDPAGRPLDAPLNVTSDVAWVGYANDRIRRQVEPALQHALRRRNLLEA